MYDSAFRPDRRTSEEVILDTQREYNRRDWEREQQKQRTAPLRDALRIARRHPNPTFRLRFSPAGDAEQQVQVQIQLLKLGVLPQQLEWPEFVSHSQAA
jgi:hypothetical protein